MSQPEPRRSTWRTQRLLEILRLKAKGLTDQQIADQMPISKATVTREINGPEARAIGQDLRDKASALVWPLVERQMDQIERGGLKPGQQVSYRGQLIKTMTGLVPKQLEQRIEQKVKVEVKRDKWSFDEVLQEYGEVIDEALETLTQREREKDALRDDREDTGEPVVSPP